MLGHDYGFKRIMSSYYFQDTDQVADHRNIDNLQFSKTEINPDVQGPPGGAPASYPNICGNGWTCEHRLIIFPLIILNGEHLQSVVKVLGRIAISY